MADFDLYDVARGGGTWSRGARDRLGRAILRQVDADDAKGCGPELAFIYCDSSYISPELLGGLADRGVWTVLMALDDQHRFLARNEIDMVVGQSVVAPLVDLYWTTWAVAGAAARNLGARTWVAGEAADPEFHHPIDVKRDIDVLFIGQRYGVRNELVSYLGAQGFSVTTFGAGWPGGFLSFEETVRAFSRAKVVLGVGNVGEMRHVHCLKGRDFEVPMCGAVYLTSYNPDLASHFAIGTEILCYGSLQQCAEILCSFREDEAGMATIRKAARSRAVRDHTWGRRIESIFGFVRGPE